jgi:hypothetical protein
VYYKNAIRMVEFSRPAPILRLIFSLEADRSPRGEKMFGGPFLSFSNGM